MSKMTSTLMFAFAGLAVAAGSIYAQSSSGTIVGTVTDASGAVVPAAAVTITNKATASARNTVADGSGNFSAPALPAGDYEVKAEKAGFKTAVRDALLQAGGNTTVNMSLAVGSASEVVTVEAATAQLNYESNAVTGVIDRAAIQDLPLNGRSFMQLAVLEPGVTISSGSTAQFNALFTVSVLGSGNRVSYTVDGGNISDSIDTGGGSTSMNISQDSIQEFQLSTVNFDISTGIGIGGAINVVTRSGTNGLHGSGYFFFRDHNMSAYPGLKRQALAPDPFFARRNPGVALGGPVRKDKLFFFFNYEHTNQVQANITQTNTASTSALNNVYSSPYIGTQNTSRVDWRPNGKQTVFARYSHDGNHGFGQVFSPGANPSNWVRNVNWADQSIIGVTSILKPTIVNDARIQYMYWSNHNLLSLPSDCVEPNCIGGGFPALLAVLGTNVGFGGAMIGNNPNAPQTRNTRRYEFNDNLSWQIGSHRLKFGGQINRTTNTGQWGFCTPYCEGIFGPATLNGAFGFPTQLRTANDYWNSPFLSLSTGIFTGIGVGPSTQPPPYNRDGSRGENQYRAYMQDTWKIRSNVTANFGLAWAAQTGYFTDFPEPAFLAPILGANNLGVTPNNTKSFSPIVGITWAPRNSTKTVIRAGGGVYWDAVPGYYHLRTWAGAGPLGNGRSTLSSQAFTNIYPGIINLGTGQPLPIGAPIPIGALTTMTLRQFDNIYNQQIGAITAKLAPTPPTSGPFTTTGIDVAKSAIHLFPPTYPIGRSYQLNFGIQRELGRRYVLTADYAMRQGENISQSDLDYNLNSRYINGVQTPVIRPCTGTELFVSGISCSSGPITFWTPQARSRYNGLLMKLQKPMSNHYQMTVSYQLAQQRANTSPWDLTNRGAAYGHTLPRHTLNVAGVINIKWGIDLTFNSQFITRSPVNPVVSSLYLPGTVPQSSSGSEPIPGLEFNCLAITCGKGALSAAVDTFNSKYAGTNNARLATIGRLALPTNYDLGDNIITQDFAVHKTFTVQERYKLLIQVQMFNALNISNLSGYSFTLDAQNPNPANQTFAFGQPTSRAAQTFGSAGPRAMQLGARFTF